MSEARTITGYATTDAVDRSGDTINPAGATFRTPFPLLLQHDHSKPIGTVTNMQRIAKGWIATATLVPPGVSDDADKAWGLIQAGALQGLSIGFRPLEVSTGEAGINYDATEIFELSVVTVPCNADCYIVGHNAKAKAVTVQALLPRYEAKSGQDYPSMPLTELRAHATSYRETYLSLARKADRRADEVLKRYEAVLAELKRRS